MEQKLYGIRSLGPQQLYWSNEDGWTDFDSATRFSKVEKDSFNLPILSVWFAFKSDVYQKATSQDKSRILCDIIETMSANDLLAILYDKYGDYETIWSDLLEYFEDKIDVIYTKEMTEP